MKKKLCLLMSVIALIFSLTACGNAGDEAEKFDTAAAEELAEFLVTNFQQFDESILEQYESLDEFTLTYQLSSSGIPIDADNFIGAMQSWYAGQEECGAFISHGEYRSEVTAGKLKLTTDAKFENRDASLTFLFNSKMRMESMTVDAKFSTGEILKKAGLNTILGMGTVFAVLIFISIIISLLKYIPDILDGMQKKKTEAPVEVHAPVVAAPEAPVQTIGDDKELIAVIAAAIAAYEGTTTDGFVVRSIKRRPSNRWNARS